MSSNGPVKEVASHKIFVGGLDLETTEEDLTEYFSKFGKVVERLIKVDIKTKKSRGFGFIGFKSPDAIERVLEIPEHFIRDKKIDCKRAMTKEEAYSLNKNLKDSCRKVFVSNIPRDTTKRELIHLFSQYGKVDEVNLMFKKKETGFCYIILESEESAVKLIDIKYIEFKGNQLEIKKAIPKDSKDSPQDDESRGKPSSHHMSVNMAPHHRHSFDTPLSYPIPFYSNQNPTGMRNLQYSKLAQQKYYETHSPHNPNIIGHRFPENISPYDRSLANHHGQMVHGEDLRYVARGMYPTPLGGGYQNLGPEGHGIDGPHRIRVMSEQQINSYKQFPMTPPGASIYYQPGDFTHLAGRKYTGQSFPHGEEVHHFQQYQKEVTENQKIPQPKPAPEFIENQINFKAQQFPKDPNDPASGSGSKVNRGSLASHGDSVQELTPLQHCGPTEAKRAKQVKILELEEEVKATKDKLRMLENLLSTYKREVEIVQEEQSYHERNSDSVNNE